MSLIKKLAGQTAIYGISTIAGRLLNYLLVPLYTRVFLPGEFGVFTELYAYAGFLMVLFTYGMETAYFRFSEKTKDYDKVFSTAFISILMTTLVITGVIIAFHHPIAQWMKYESHPEYILWFALILGFDALTAIPFARIRQKNQPLKFAVIRLANILANIGFNLFFLVFCPWILKNSGSDALTGFIQSVYNPEIGVGYVFISNLIASAITLVLLSGEILGRQLKFESGLWKQMMRYALPLLIVGFAGIINELIDRILLRRLLPFTDAENLVQLGIYGACYKLSIMINLFTQAFRYAAEPFFFSQSSELNAKDTYAKTMKFFVIAGCGIFLAIMLFLDTAKYFIGKEYWEGLRVVPILLLANLALGIYYNLSIWYKLTDKTLGGAYISIGGAFITIALNIWWIPIFGYMGSAWATLACYTLMVLASYVWGAKHYPVPYEVKRILFYIAFSIVIYFAQVTLVAFLNVESLVQEYLSGLVLLTFYGTVVWMTERKTV